VERPLLTGSKGLEQTVYRRARSFIVLSEAFRNIPYQEYGVPLERIYVVPGVDAERFDTTFVPWAKLGWPQDRPIIPKAAGAPHGSGKLDRSGR